jgi:hypothetical protein
MSNGMGNNQSVYSLILFNDNIFAGTASGVYLSSNNGTNWIQTSLNNQHISSFYALGNNIIAGGYDYSGVFVSSNNGMNWTQTSLNNRTVYSLVTSQNNIFAGTDSGIYFSNNNGTNWIQTFSNNQSVFSIATSGNNIFAGTYNNGVYLSSNNGTNWTQTSLNNRTVLSILLLSNNFYAGTDSGVYRSTNNGTNWIQTTLNNKIVYSLVTTGNNIFAGIYYDGVYLSTNNGISWLNINQGFYNFITVYALLIKNNYIFAATGTSSVWRRSLSEIIGIKQIAEFVPSSYSLQQNYPNPFNPSTNIRYEIPKNSFVKLVVFDILGKKIETLVNEKLKPGSYEVTFNATNYPSGVYFYRLTTDGFNETKRMIIIK